MSNLLTFSTLNFFPRRFYLAASGMCRAVIDLHNESEMAMSGPRMRLCFGRLGQSTHHLCGYLHEDRERPRHDAIHELTAEIAQKANWVFIWVRIVVEELIERYVDGISISQLREVLSAMPEGLKDLYRRDLSKVKTEYALKSYIMIQIVP